MQLKVFICLIGIILLSACAEFPGLLGEEAKTTTSNSQVNASSDQTSESQALPQSSPEVIALASQYGFPPVETGSQVIGPFSGPDNSIFYADKTGRVSYFSPGQMTAFFGQVDSGGTPQVQYMLTPVGNYGVENGNPVQLQIPPDISGWPFSDAMIQVMIQTLTAYTNNPGSVTPSWENASVISSNLHNINMNILQNMGSEGCTEHYEGVYYLGCY